MVLESKQTTLAYRCPACGSGVMTAVSLFHLKGSMIRLKCECGESVLEALPTGDGKVRLTVPCIICPTPHHYTVSESIFFGKELFSLPCPYSDLNLCMMGETNHVKAELSRTELQLLDLMEEHGISDFHALHSRAEQTVTDPQVLEVVLFVIRDLDEEGKILCRCAEGEEREYDAEILPEGVRVTCKKCGASKLIPTDSHVTAHDFLNCDFLKLE